jgi:hypothetical protein
VIKRAPFKDEGDLRKLIKKWAVEAGCFALWSEAAIGGTTGQPDVVVVGPYELGGGVAKFCELKVGGVAQDGQWIEFIMANAQRIVLRKIARVGGLAWVIIAEKGGTRVWACQPLDVKPVPMEGEADTVKGRIPHRVRRVAAYELQGNFFL